MQVAPGSVGERRSAIERRLDSGKKGFEPRNRDTEAGKAGGRTGCPAGDDK